MPRLDGTDTFSEMLIIESQQGVKPKELAEKHHITIDQAKRISRYANYLSKVAGEISAAAYHKMKALGLKSLVFSHLIKESDFKGLEEVLHASSPAMKRDTLATLSKALEEKRERIKEFEREVSSKLSRLERKEKDLREKQSEIDKLQKKILRQYSFIKKYDNDVQTFFMEHIGFSNPRDEYQRMNHEPKLCLSRRIDYRWQKNLRKKGILEYSEQNYVYYINDLDALVEQLQLRIKRGWPIYWDEEKAYKLTGNSYYSDKFRNAEGLSSDFHSTMAQINEDRKKLKEQKEQLQKEIRSLKKKSPKSFMERVQTTNYLSDSELEIHGKLQDRVMRFLYDMGYVVASEYTLDNKKRVDVIGYDPESEKIIIVEVKASRNDFIQDTKWDTYLTYCDEFYFAIEKKQRGSISLDVEKSKAGYWLIDKGNLHIEEHSGCELQCQAHGNRQDTIVGINRFLSRKYIQGF